MGTDSPTKYPVFGPDISFYQDDPTTMFGVDFQKMKAVGSKFVLIRAGQNKWGDKAFRFNWTEAKRAGLLRGSYWFYDSRVSPKEQAKLWVSMHDGDLGEMELWADYEEIYNGKYSNWGHFYDFLEAVKSFAPGKKIGIYTGYYYWMEKTQLISKSQKEYFKQYSLWLAAYNLSGPIVPAPWTSWKFWQFTSNGNGALFGVESLDIDLNYYSGTLEKFSMDYPGQSTPAPDYKIVGIDVKLKSQKVISYKE